MCNVAELKAARKEIERLKSELAPLVPPAHRGTISGDYLRQLLTEKFDFASVYISDKTKYLCDIEDVNIFLEQDKTNRERYVANDYDCDDFTYRLMGQFSVPGWAKFAKGILWTNTHALLCFVDTNCDVWTIEPQTDGYSKIENPISARIIMM